MWKQSTEILKGDAAGLLPVPGSPVPVTGLFTSEGPSAKSPSPSHGAATSVGLTARDFIAG